MVDFVKAHSLQPIIGEGWSDEELEVHLLHQAEIASQSPTKLDYVNRELMMQLAIMSLYDLAVLIDDSTSMEFEQGGERKRALKEVLHLLADLYGAVSDDMRGIKAIRFLNGIDDLKADDIKGKDDIDDVIDNHQFEGLTCIGAGLMRKILKPFVFSDEPWIKGTSRKLRKVERPLLIMVITDGAVDGEDPTWLQKAIASTVDCLKKSGVGTKAVVFQFVRVGDDKDAEEFLRELDDESDVKDYVDTLSGTDLMELMDLRKAQGKNYTENDQRKLIKLLLGPICPSYDNFVDSSAGDFIDIADDF